MTSSNEYFLLDGFNITRLFADSKLENDCAACRHGSGYVCLKFGVKEMKEGMG
jgi:hypothetical protein